MSELVHSAPVAAVVLVLGVTWLKLYRNGRANGSFNERLLRALEKNTVAFERNAAVLDNVAHTMERLGERFLELDRRLAGRPCMKE